MAVPIERAPEWLREMARLLPDVVNDGMYSAAIRMEQDLKTDPTLGTPVDRGHYRMGWTAERTENGADIFNRVDHAVFIEEGVRAYPNNPPGRAMIDALAEWAKRKGLAVTWKAKGKITAKKRTMSFARVPMVEKQLRSLAFAIAWAIRKRGVFNPPNGLQILANLFRTRGKAYVEEEVKRELLKWWTQ